MENDIKHIILYNTTKNKKKLTSAQTSLLSKGLNFALTPEKIPVADFIVATEQACVGLPPARATQLRAEITGAFKSSKPPVANINKDESRALSQLKKDSTIMILPADKGKAVVVMDTEEYTKKVLIMLNDKKTYVRLNKDPTPSFKRRLLSILNRLKTEGKISDLQYKDLYPTTENVPRLYCTPKIHKEGTPLRPIVDYTGSVGYNTSRALVDLLSPLIGKTEHHVHNSKQLARDLGSILIEEDEVIASHDVVSLFTYIPVPETIAVIKRSWRKIQV